MVRFREKSGQPDSAAALMVELSRAEPNNQEVQAVLKDFIDRTIAAGSTARNYGRFAEAEACYRRLKNLRPDSEIEQYIARVKLAEKEKEKQQLVAEAEEARRNDPARRGVGNPSSGTFGALGVPAQGGGIYVTGTLQGSPAEASRLEAGDVIVSINGVAVDTQDQFVKAVHDSPDVMNFVVKDVRTGQRMSMSVKLNRPK
jgi:predicted metalloprotease with PDZ domain